MARRTDAPGAPRGVYALRLGADERALMEAAAAACGVPLAAYIRQVTLAAARRELAARPADREPATDR